MEPLNDVIDTKRTRILVGKHMKSLQRLKFMITTANDYNKVSSSVINGSSQQSSGPSKGEQLLNKIETADMKNQEVEEYMNYIISSINKLDKGDRWIILCKYFYRMDEEELTQEFGVGSRKLYDYLIEAEVRLALILDCVVLNKAKANKIAS